ncbi:putative Mg2+ transporter-C (MgtC) family protein [Pantoea alhagi]|uniref:MgtC/SapB family protein n=1 Tax=Mixta sp. BE291 TaxID=3158787 RepID=UPI00285631E5|nr:putative Mg2+ transporter-C (MgtC) family protein [Pantoea alhagi]
MYLQLYDYFSTIFNQWEVLIKFSVSFLLGSIIGWERESKNKPVGIKTCIIIAITSCLLTQVSIQSAEHYAGMSVNIRTDPMRLAAQVISGIGFLGAGVILHRQRDSISGLTTAAIIWASAGVGIACGSGFYFYATFSTLLFFLAIRFSHTLGRFRQSDGYIHKIAVQLTLADSSVIPEVFHRMHEKKFLLETLDIHDTKKGKIIMCMKISVRKRITVYSLYSMLKNIESVDSVSLGR